MKYIKTTVDMGRGGPVMEFESDEGAIVDLRYYNSNIRPRAIERHARHGHPELDDLYPKAERLFEVGPDGKPGREIKFEKSAEPPPITP